MWMMFLDASPGSTPLVDAHVEPLRAGGLQEHTLGLSRQLQHLKQDSVIELGQRAHVRIGHDHHMPITVRIAVQDHKTRSPAIEHVLSRVIRGDLVAEYAPLAVAITAT